MHPATCIYLLLLYPANIYELLKKDRLQNILKNKCPFDPNQDITGDYYFLAGRYNSKSEVLLRSGRRITKITFNIQAGYVPVSEKTYKKLMRKLTLLAFAAFLFITLTVWSIPLIILLVEATVWQIIMLFGFIPAIMCLLIRLDVINNISKKIINLNHVYKDAGIPKYNNRPFKDFARINDINKMLPEQKLIKINL